MPGVITPPLARRLRERFRLDWRGIHGVRHWARVRANGLLLAERIGHYVNRRVVELFAFLHDSCRNDDGYDPMHGARAAESLDELLDVLPVLSKEERGLLRHACERHSEGLLDAELTVQVCWDADRLDLGRVGYMPHPSRLCTPAARNADLIRWAYERSTRIQR